MENKEPTRKAAKGRGVDADAARRAREERAVQIRKEKRFDRANIERRKFKVDEEASEPVVQSSGSKVHSYSILPQKCQLLTSGTPQQQLESAMFFRRILAADKNPPLDMIIETGVVVPTLIAFLSRTEMTSLQIEAAWSLTNIACGEPRHVHCLIQAGAVQELVKVVSTTKSMPLKDQALWAICNMTAVAEACEYALTMPNFMVLMMQPVGLECETFNSNTGQRSNVFQTPDCVLQRIFQQPSADGTPTLSTMRHVTFICGNIARQKHALPPSWYRMILFTMSELVHSPDDEIVLDICACLITLLQDHPELVTTVLELGLVRKMREFLESHSPSSNVFELALLVLCAVLRCPDTLCRSVVLSSGSAGQGAGLGQGVFCQPVNPTVQSPDLSQLPLQSVYSSNSFTAAASMAALAPTANSSLSSFAFGVGVAPPSGGFYFGSEDAAMTDDSTAVAAGEDGSPATVVPPQSTLAHIVRHLGRTENALTRSDICRTLLCVIDMGARYAEVCVACGVESTLARLIAQDAFDLKVDAGELLCALVQCDGLSFTPQSMQQRAAVLKDLLTVSEPNLLVNAIWALKALITYAIMQQMDVPYHAEILEAAEQLMMHPVQQIADLACTLEDQLSNCGGDMDSDEEY